MISSTCGQASCGCPRWLRPLCWAYLDVKYREEGFRLDLDFRPLVVFPKLSGWCVEKPPASLREQYLRQLTAAVEFLNDASIAHLDLRPDNVMWRAVGGESDAAVEMKLIDFDDAALFDHPIPQEFVSYVVDTRDYRYPFQEGDEESEQLAAALHNQFFLDAAELWLQSEVDHFTDFMWDRGQHILRTLKEKGGCIHEDWGTPMKRRRTDSMDKW
eukprot:CAMPEP_0170092152 /NCGR_PEP_ID=MMETSP0019_2-20121128/25574_1 /TAXON_ID=98059 /ORGANISM="Dinobryon sp., Strain UTEXLB2267" /LENGTH=214 /DNA_ID=CAMNT_0010312405 /DNA_START=423 /DNA_END=1064 /DNA_ORIENTATION=-